MLAKQGGLEPFCDQPLARPGDRVDTGLQRRRDLAVAPARTTLRGVSFQQDAGLQQLLCRMFPAMDKGGELLSFLIAECHNVLLYRDLFSGHEPAPSLVTEASRQKIDVESMTDTTRCDRLTHATRASVDALIEQKRYGVPLYRGRSVIGWEPGQPSAQTAISEE